MELGEELNVTCSLMSTHGTTIVISATKFVLRIKAGSWIWQMLQLIQKFVMVDSYVLEESCLNLIEQV
jgi:hypothetical protein